jgi:hypothetical protein
MLSMTLACIAVVIGYRWIRRRKQLAAMHALAGGAHEVAVPEVAPTASSSEQQGM